MYPIRSILFWGALYCAYGFLTPFWFFCVLFNVLTSPSWVDWHLGYAGKIFFRLARLCFGLEIEVRGLENIPKDTPVLFACGHYSVWESFVFFWLLKARPVPNEKLAQIPVFGFFLKKCGIVVQRDEKPLNFFVESARKLVEDGRSIYLFPAGKRVPFGGVFSYKAGVYQAAQTLNVPIVPVAHNSGAFCDFKLINVCAGTVVVAVLPPVFAPPPAATMREEATQRRAFMKNLQNLVEKNDF